MVHRKCAASDSSAAASDAAVAADADATDAGYWARLGLREQKQEC